MKSGNLNLLEPSGPVQACNGIAFTTLQKLFLLPSSGWGDLIECSAWKNFVIYLNSPIRFTPAWICRPGRLSRYSVSQQAGRSGDRIPVLARFSTPVHTGPGTHPASYTRGTGSFPGVKRPGRVLDHQPPPHFSVEVKERVELNLCSHSGPSCPVRGWTLPLLFTCLKIGKLYFKK